ncbi:MAG: CAAX prenyl protease-related protein [Isosphaeraceae bacterium]
MTESAPSPHSWLLYVAPMATFLVLTSLEGYLPQSAEGPHLTWYPVAYAVKIAVVVVAAWLCRAAWRDLKPWPGLKTLALAIGLGVAVAVVWVGLDGHYPSLPFLGTRQGFDPGKLSGPGRLGFLAIRMVGLVVVVPFIEELFWRSFLMRIVIDPEFERVPVGRVTPAAAAITSLFFALAHPEWLPALLTGLAWAWLLWKSKSLSACVASHMAANLALGIYVLVTGHWSFL